MEDAEDITAFAMANGAIPPLEADSFMPEEISGLVNQFVPFDRRKEQMITYDWNLRVWVLPHALAVLGENPRKENQ